MFLESVRRVARGGSAVDPEVVSRLVGRHRREDPVARLTPREREVLELMAEGRSNVAIAEALVVTERAVEKHVTGIFGKLGLAPAPEDHRRVLAVLTFLGADGHNVAPRPRLRLPARDGRDWANARLTRCPTAWRVFLTARRIEFVARTWPRVRITALGRGCPLRPGNSARVSALSRTGSGSSGVSVIRKISA